MTTAPSDTRSLPEPSPSPAHRSTGRPGTAVSLRDVRKSFGKVQAVRGIDLDIDRGEVVAFLGPNGAGKTSTIDMVLGLSDPTGGDVSVFGLAPERAIEHGLVAAVMQSGGFLRDLSVRETVEYTAALFPNHRPVDDVMRTAGIVDIGGRRVVKCSGGEQQRLRFAMALVSDPELIILDEPTTGMDVETRRTFWQTIRADAEQGRTIVFATHYLEEADQYADRIVLVRQGQIVADGTSAQIKALGTGRVVRATWPGVSDADLTRVPGAEGVDLHGDIVTIRCADSDAAARWLLTHTPATDLEITARGLEDAFVALTGDHQEGH